MNQAQTILTVHIEVQEEDKYGKIEDRRFTLAEV